MQLKNSMLLLTALTAGSAVGRLHGHERRHHHDKRAVGDMVYATIDGVLESWINKWSGHAETSSSSSTSTATLVAEATPASSVIASVSAVVTPEASASVSVGSSSGSSDWTATPSNGQYSSSGFGQKSSGTSGSGITFKGNVGNPWGSNIIEVSADSANQYKHVAQFTGSNTDPWTIVFWNKIGPDGGLNGWYNGNSALTLTLQPGDTKYVAFDDDSQGGWGAAQGTKIPTDQYGAYACTWGEFDFGNSDNNGWSGWDVSAIMAQNAGLEVQGMNICDHLGGKCSTITNLAEQIINAYSNLLAGVDGIGGSLTAGPVRLAVHVNYNK